MIQQSQNVFASRVIQND